MLTTALALTNPLTLRAPLALLALLTRTALLALTAPLALTALLALTVLWAEGVTKHHKASFGRIRPYKGLTGHPIRLPFSPLYQAYWAPDESGPQGEKFPEYPAGSNPGLNRDPSGPLNGLLKAVLWAPFKGFLKALIAYGFFEGFFSPFSGP